MNLSARTKCVPAVVPTAGSVGALTAVEVDASGFDRALFTIATGAAGTGATLDVKIQNAATSGGSYADVTGAALTQVLEAGANKIYEIDMLVNPAKPFLKVVGTVATQTMANSVTCRLYEGSRTYPATGGATQSVIAS